MSDDFFSDGNHASVCDVSSFFDSSVPKLIGDLVSLGVLVSVGTTRDRGAVSITVTSDGRWRRDYFRSSDDAADWLGLAAASLRARGLGLPETDRPVTQTPTRGRSRGSSAR